MGLFEVYDSFTYLGGLSFNWSFIGFVYFGLFLSYWRVGGSVVGVAWVAVSGLLAELGNFFSVLKTKFTVLVFITLFFYLLAVNLVGLIPYAFACSAHFVFALSLGLPLWLGFIVLGWLKFTDSMFSHLIPIGTPLPLISFMVIIETISNLIRPGSISVRLMANMISGHLLMSLLGDCGPWGLVAQLFLIGFEFFVCFIQAYVFTALLTMYSSEI